MPQKPRKAETGMCSWRCGRPVTPGLSQHTRQPFGTCGICRKRYALTKKINTLQRQIDGNDPLLQIAARLKLDSLLADIEHNPEKYAWTPADDAADVVPEKEKQT